MSIASEITLSLLLIVKKYVYSPKLCFGNIVLQKIIICMQFRGKKKKIYAKKVSFLKCMFPLHNFFFYVFLSRARFIASIPCDPDPWLLIHAGMDRLCSSSLPHRFTGFCATHCVAVTLWPVKRPAHSWKQRTQMGEGISPQCVT